jgi:hypothetical protein
LSLTTSVAAGAAAGTRSGEVIVITAGKNYESWRWWKPMKYKVKYQALNTGKVEAKSPEEASYLFDEELKECLGANMGPMELKGSTITVILPSGKEIIFTRPFEKINDKLVEL